MSIIDVKNSSQLRDPMEVHVVFSSKDDQQITVPSATGIKASDINYQTSIAEDGWAMVDLADFQGDGYLLDGSCQYLDERENASLQAGKIGLRSSVDSGMMITFSSSTTINALTIKFRSGSGTVRLNGEDYDITGFVTMPVNATSGTLIINNTASEQRIEIDAIYPGIFLNLNQENITSCSLDLRSDLSMESPTVEVSSISVEAFWPYDISEVIGNCSDDTPIIYYAGYPGDYSPEREFYLSEPATMTDNLISFTGEDSSNRLDDKSTNDTILATSNRAGKRDLYNYFVKNITDAGVVLKSKETPPAVSSGTATAATLIFKESTSRDIVSDIMNLSHVNQYWPTFVDAGRPAVYHSKPTAKWMIYESDCGEVQRNIDKNIAAIESDDEVYGLHTNVARSGGGSVNESVEVTAGAGESWEAESDQYIWGLTVSNAKSVLITASKAVWTAVKTGISVVKGTIMKITTSDKRVKDPGGRMGYTMTASPAAYGKALDGDTFLYPNYNSLFNRSNISGQFKWKGDPRMQPRDVFAFRRLDGSEELCTIEGIELTHEEGGTSAVISYRKGVC